MTYASAESSAEWGRRFTARIVERLTVEGSPWTREQAEAAAEAELEAIDSEDRRWARHDTPEDSADEALTYWEDDGDE